MRVTLCFYYFATILGPADTYRKMWFLMKELQPLRDWVLKKFLGM